MWGVSAINTCSMHKDVMELCAFIGFGLDSNIWSCHDINIGTPRRGKYPSGLANTMFVVE